MIALVILGLGLLFIAAALPVGLDYTRQTVDLATGEATGEYALDELERNLRTSGNDLYEPSLFVLSIVHRLDNIHRPRDRTPYAPPRFLLRPTYEPVIKVRPLALGNIGMSRVGTEGVPGAQRGAELVDNAESAISLYLVSVWGLSITNPDFVRREFEFPYDGSGSLDDLLSLVNNPVLAGVARLYPPIEPVTTFSAGAFFNDGSTYPTYQARFARLDASDPTLLHREREKAVDRRVAWTAFYRRLSYKGQAGTDTQWYTDDDVAENSLLYEIIVVVTRRTSVSHRFPRQDLSVSNPFEQPQAMPPTAAPPDLTGVGVDRLAPTPWLVTFDPNQPLPALPAYSQPLPPPGGSPERVVAAGALEPPTLTFRCTPGVGVLLPVGSIFIPAVNDQRYTPPAGPGLPQLVGFVPSAPESLPIYEVVERPDDRTAVVKNNGYYPWVNPDFAGLNARQFPVWVIPPPFVERDSSGQPIYERSSPIVRVVRRTVTLHEITP